MVHTVASGIVPGVMFRVVRSRFCAKNRQLCNATSRVPQITCTSCFHTCKALMAHDDSTFVFSNILGDMQVFSKFVSKWCRQLACHGTRIACVLSATFICSVKEGMLGFIDSRDAMITSLRGVLIGRLSFAFVCGRPHRRSMHHIN